MTIYDEIDKLNQQALDTNDFELKKKLIEESQRLINQAYNFTTIKKKEINQ